MKTTMTIAILAFPRCPLLDVIGPLEVFAEVNRQTGAPIYRTEIVSTVEGPVVGSSGISVVANRSINDPNQTVDTMLVAGALDIEDFTLSDVERKWIMQSASTARRYGSICSGAFMMAQTGLLAGKRITTHWSKTERLAKKHPELFLEPDAIFVRDGAVATSAGVTAGIDLALALVEEDCGRLIALDTARELVVYLKRSGGQSQFSAHLSAQMSSIPAIEAVQTYGAENPALDLSLNALATRAGMSARNFSRIFHKETGVTPKDFVEVTRVDIARRLIIDGVPLQRVATRSGFQSINNLRRAFARRLMTTPSVYRENFGNHRE